MTKVHIATARSVGLKCIEWAKDNCPSGFELTENINECDIIISVLYDKIFKPSIVNNKKCYNIHPGILPDYKGVGICSWVILNEEDYMGATLHVINEGVDTGNIIHIEKFLVKDQDTAYCLFNKVEKLIYNMFKEWFVDLLNENFISTPQTNTNNVTYKRKDIQSAMDLTKFVKAFYFPGKPAAYYFDRNGEKKHIDFDY